MQRKKCVFSVLFASALVFGACFGLSFKDKKAASLSVRADDEPNSSFVKIYDDNTAYNNTAISSKFNQVLIVYSGVAHGLTSSGIYDSAVLGKISLNGTPLTSLPGSVVIPWEGQYWFRIAYPNTVVEDDVLEVQSGITIGDAIFEGFKLKLNENQKWDYCFGDSVNATFKSIYNDDYNNTAQWDGWNRVLITYTGPAHNHPAAISGNELKKYNAYVFLNGQPFSSFGGNTQIAPWSGQYWFLFIYPATAVSQGSVLEIREGTKIGDTVLEKMEFVLNSSSKWEKQQNLIEDDFLVKNNDYLLFTPSEVSAGHNDSWSFYSPAPVNEMADLNFGLQFKVNMTDEELGGYVTLKFGTNFASDEFLSLLINFKVNTYIHKFKGATVTLGLTNISVTPGVDHIFEFYCLKASSSTACFILGIDGVIIFKTLEQDISDAPSCLHFGMLNSGAAPTSGVSSLTTTTGAALTRFSNRALHMDTIPTSSTADTGACKGVNGYYAKAKAYYNKYLVASQRVAFASGIEYVNQRERFTAWATANGETITFDTTTGALTASRISNVIFFDKENSGIYFAIIVAVIATISAAGVFIMLKKKKHTK